MKLTNKHKLHIILKYSKQPRPSNYIYPPTLNLIFSNSHHINNLLLQTNGKTWVREPNLSPNLWLDFGYSEKGIVVKNDNISICISKGRILNLLNSVSSTLFWEYDASVKGRLLVAIPLLLLRWMKDAIRYSTNRRIIAFKTWNLSSREGMVVGLGERKSKERPTMLVSSFC